MLKNILIKKCFMIYVKLDYQNSIILFFYNNSGGPTNYRMLINFIIYYKIYFTVYYVVGSYKKII